ncbi:diguanylate cyclase [Vibrio panuliri]|uniref:diguanylate cyclase n=1 Tax=Vibrio panuliri TaxID=1381081 RepID=A0ABX3FH54_9VIBR|nr:diguanylate cyclase [Vibrio panuliri]OLQ89986.1 diguanylate cyclase [Vibrio panuliri]
MTHFLARLFAVSALLASFYTNALSDRAQWEKAYADASLSNKQRALALLQDRYNALPPGVEKLYVSSKLHGFMLLHGQPYYGNQNRHDGEFASQEQLFIDALNSEEQLDFVSARNSYLTLLDQVDKQDSLDGKILLEYHLCRVLNRQSLYHQAEVYCSSLQTHIEDIAEPILPKYIALRVIANNQEFLGEYQAALDTYQQLLKLIPSYVDSSGIYNDAGLLLATLGHYQQAKEYINTALTMRADDPASLKLAQSHHSMGKVMLKQQLYELAITHFAQSIKIAQQYNHLYGLAFGQLGIGQAYIGLKDYPQATQFLFDALDSATKQQNHQLRGEIYLALAGAHETQKKYLTALEFAQQALDLSTTIGSDRLTSQALEQLAKISERQENYDLALKYYRDYARLELKKRDKESKNAFVALDLARRDYFHQIRNETLSNENLSLRKMQNASEQKAAIYSFVALLLLLAVTAQFVYHKKRCAELKLDGLSGCLSRTVCIRNIKKQRACSSADHRHILVLLDLDNFKSINDTFGHPIGDLMLKRVGQVIREQTSSVDFTGRFGGEEFMLLLKEVDELDIQQRIEQLHTAISSMRLETDGYQAVQVTATLAYLATTKALNDFDELYSILDQALYQAKKSGKNRVIDAYNDPIYLG